MTRRVVVSILFPPASAGFCEARRSDTAPTLAIEWLCRCASAHNRDSEDDQRDSENADDKCREGFQSNACPMRLPDGHGKWILCPSTVDILLFCTSGYLLKLGKAREVPRVCRTTAICQRRSARSPERRRARRITETSVMCRLLTRLDRPVDHPSLS